jgi:hypothetical protein
MAGVPALISFRIFIAVSKDPPGPSLLERCSDAPGLLPQQPKPMVTEVAGRHVIRDDRPGTAFDLRAQFREPKEEIRRHGGLR